MTSFVRFSLIGAIAGLATASFGSAQTEKTQIIVVSPVSSGCVVEMRAEREPGLTARVPVGKSGSIIAKPHHETGQELQLMFTNSSKAAISGLRITLHGWSGEGRMLPTVSVSDGNASRTLNLTLSLAPRATAEIDGRVSGLATVESIDLVGVSYADGSTWNPAASQACRIMPDPVMLISHR